MFTNFSIEDRFESSREKRCYINIRVVGGFPPFFVTGCMRADFQHEGKVEMD